MHCICSVHIGGSTHVQLPLVDEINLSALDAQKHWKQKRNILLITLSKDHFKRYIEKQKCKISYSL